MRSPESLNIQENHPNHDDSKIAGTFNNLGLAYLNLEQYAEAEVFFQQALFLHEKEYALNNKSRVNLATNLENLGSLYIKMYRYSEAEQVLTRSLLIQEQIFFQTHPSIATTLNHLVDLSWSQDNLQKSLELLQRSLAVQEANILRNLTLLTELDQRTYLNTVGYTEDWIVSLHLQHLPTNPQASATALTTILRRKGRILDTLRIMD